MSQQALRAGITNDVSATEEATARTLILALLYRYASLARENGDYTQVEKLFQPGGTVRFPDGRELPPSKLGEITRDNGPKYLRHHLTTIDIQFVSSDEAHCQSYVIAATDKKFPDHWGQWNDVVRKQDAGRWLFKEKAVLVGGMDPDGWLAGMSPK